MSIMSQYDGTMSAHSSRQITKCCHCGCYHFNKNRKIRVTRVDTSCQTDGTECEIETEDNKIFTLPELTSQQKHEEQDMFRPYYIKEEVAPETNSILQGYQIKYNRQNNLIPQGFICTCREKGVCPFEVNSDDGICNAGPEERMQVDGEVQADLFEIEDPIKCMTCGTVLPDRSCCIRRYILSAYECNGCYAKNGSKTSVPSYLQIIRGQYAASSLKTVPCQYCLKFFGTVKGMRIHQGRIHKPFVVKH